MEQHTSSLLAEPATKVPKKLESAVLTLHCTAGYGLRPRRQRPGAVQARSGAARPLPHGVAAAVRAAITVPSAMRAPPSPPTRGHRGHLVRSGRPGRPAGGWPAIRPGRLWNRPGPAQPEPPSGRACQSPFPPAPPPHVADQLLPPLTGPPNPHPATASRSPRPH